MRETILAVGLILVGQQVAIVLLLWRKEYSRRVAMAVSAKAQAIVDQITIIANHVQVQMNTAAAALAAGDNSEDLDAIQTAVGTLQAIVNPPVNPVTPPQ